MRRRVLISVPLVLGLALPAFAQEAPPLIDVPTTPVPQTPTPPTTAAPPKAKPAPAPAPTTGGGAGGGGGGGAPAAPKTDEAAKEPIKYNNEGVFKVSGAGGSGIVGGQKTKGAAATPAAKGTGKGAVAKKAQTAMVAQWPGFRMLDDGSSEVLVDFSNDPSAPTEHKAAGSVTYVFKGAHVIKANNKNPLITVHFNTPVTSVRLVPSKGSLNLVIDMRAGTSASPTTAMIAGEGGGTSKMFVVKFPAGTYLPAGAEDAEDPSPNQKLKAKGKKSETAPTTPPPSTTGTGATKPGPSE